MSTVEFAKLSNASSLQDASPAELAAVEGGSVLIPVLIVTTAAIALYLYFESQKGQ